MNCESWLDPKKLWITAEMVREFTRSVGVICSWSWSDMRSRMMRAMRARPMLNWFASSSPTERTRRLPRWSMSSVIAASRPRSVTISPPVRSSSRYLMMTMKSSRHSVVWLRSGMPSPSCLRTSRPGSRYSCGSFWFSL